MNGFEMNECIGKRYVLVTAAYNEDKYIEGLIKSVAAQTHKPLRWVIVSDGSTDRTEEVVTDYAARYAFIGLHRVTKDHPRNFAAQVHAINAGFSLLDGLAYDYIGNLDSDVSFAPTYFETLIGRFEQDPRLGLAGGYICEEHNGEFKPRPLNRVTSVPHAVQFFRRECFQVLGGYLPLPYGGPDWHAEVTARMNGWAVRSFPDLRVFHHRPTASAEGRLRSWYRQGLEAYSLGSHPAFEVAKTCVRLGSRPPLVGALVRLSAFALASIRRLDRPVPDEFVRFLRAEQMARLFRFSASGRDAQETHPQFR
jgi:hypothetical protein